MNKNRKLIVSIVVVLLLIITFVNFSAFSSSQTMDINTELIQEKQFEKQFKEAPYTVDGKIIIDETEIIFKYSDRINVSIEKYIPYYKNIEYADNAYYKWTAKGSDGKQYIKFGHISLTGIYVIKGFISSTSAEKKIKKTLRTTIEKEIEKEAKKALNLKSSTSTKFTKITNF